MNALDQTLEKPVNALADICCAAIANEQQVERSAEVIHELVRKGYHRLSDIALKDRIERIVESRDANTFLRHRDLVEAISKTFQQTYDQELRNSHGVQTELNHHS